jgi:SAM-dependent methyltransferase
MGLWHRLLEQRRSPDGKFRRKEYPLPAGHLSFVCNICASCTAAPLKRVGDREYPSCPTCRSSGRLRAVVAALLERLVGEVMPLQHLPPRQQVRGLGMSDLSVYSTLLQEKFDYVNTFYHREPYLDITDPDPRLRSQFDFVICSDVMEHVPPPVETAFKNLRSLLRPKGLLVLTVPFSRKPETVEHFPDLYQFEIIGSGKERQLVNATRNGEKQVFNNLIFHGGEGATLEMRVFSEAALLKLLRESNFQNVRIHARWFPEWGIIHPLPLSLPITAIAR